MTVTCSYRAASRGAPGITPEGDEQREEQKAVEARMAVFDFIEGWYNPHRRHSGLDYESPISYEQRHPVVA